MVPLMTGALSTANPGINWTVPGTGSIVTFMGVLAIGPLNETSLSVYVSDVTQPAAVYERPTGTSHQIRELLVFILVAPCISVTYSLIMYDSRESNSLFFWPATFFRNRLHFFHLSLVKSLSSWPKSASENTVRFSTFSGNRSARSWTRRSRQGAIQSGSMGRTRQAVCISTDYRQERIRRRRSFCYC